MPNARRGSTPNQYVGTVGNFTTPLLHDVPVEAQVPLLPLEISRPLWTGEATVDTIRIPPEVRKMDVPQFLQRVAGQHLACHMSHCGGAMSPHTWAVHTSRVLNKDAYWSILPVDPDDEDNGAVVITKVEDRGHHWASGGEAWSSGIPLFLTLAAPNFDHLASLDETATLPLIITAFTGPWRNFQDLPGQFHWKFLNPPCPASDCKTAA